MPYFTNRNKQIYPDLPNTPSELCVLLRLGSLYLDSNDRSQYLIQTDVDANDGRHSEEIPIVNKKSLKIVGVIHLHWDKLRNLQYMHAKEHMLGFGKYTIPYYDEFWEPIVKNIIQ
jgi:hypothetical protein